MKVAKLTYEECRRKRVEKNRKRMEALHLPQLSQYYRNISPKPTPMKQVKLPTPRKQLVALKSSNCFVNNPSPICVEAGCGKSFGNSSKNLNRTKTSANRVYASDEARAYATEKAEELQSGLGSKYPSFVKPMLQSHVTGGFWLGLPSYFTKKHLLTRDEIMTLVDEDGDNYQAIYLARKSGLSGGWRGFAVAHKLVDGDALVFHLIQPTTFKVYIVRVNGYEESKKR